MYLNSWQGHELKVAVMRNTLESEVEKIMREKEQKESYSRKVESEVKKIGKFKNTRKEKSHSHKTKKEGRIET